MTKRSNRKVKRFFKAVGVADILQVCKEIKLDSRKSNIDWDSLIRRVTERTLSLEEKERHALEIREDPESFLGRSRHRQKMEIQSIDSDDGSRESDGDVKMENSLNVKIDHSMITIGTIGHPNVGKSSLINGILGKKTVSVSKTPGHTKHFQTIHISENIRLCDCPGLGTFCISLNSSLSFIDSQAYSDIIWNVQNFTSARVRWLFNLPNRPYTSVTFLAECIPLIEILQLKHPDQEENGFFWSGWMICEAFALQRGFLTPKVGRPDVYRAANLILRMANDGRLLLVFRPIGFWKNHHDVRYAQQKADLDKPGFFKEMDTASDTNDSGADADSETDDIESLDLSLDQSFAPLSTLSE